MKCLFITWLLYFSFEVLLVYHKILSYVWFHWRDRAYCCVPTSMILVQMRFGWIKVPPAKCENPCFPRGTRKETQQSKQNLSKPRVQAADQQKGSFKEILDGKQWQQQGLWTSLSISTPHPLPPPLWRDTLLNIPIGEWAETQPHEFKWPTPWMPMLSVFPAATNLYFPYGSLSGKWKSVAALPPLPASPLGDGRRSEVKEISDSRTRHTKGT